MKVLVVSAAFPPMQTAEADYAFHFCRRLADRGVNVQLVTSPRSDLAVPDGVEVFADIARWDWLGLPRLISRICRSKPDAIVLLYLGWIYEGHPMITFLPAICRWRWPDLRFVTLLYNRYGADLSRASWLTHRLQRLAEYFASHREVLFEFGALLTHSDHVFALNHAHAARVKSISPSFAQNVRVLPSLPIMMLSSVDKAQARRESRSALGVSADQKLIGFFGYLYPGKGLEDLLRALSLISDGTKLLVIGGTLDPASGQAEYPALLSRLITELGIGDRVISTGSYAWDSESASRYLHCVDALVLPFEIGISLNNSSVAAATAHALPIISTRGPELETAFVHGENVWLCPPNDPQSLARAIQHVLAAPDLRQHLARGAARLSGSHFSWDSAIDTVLRTLSL